MKDIDLFDLKESLKEKGVLICFVGQFSHIIIEEIGLAIRKYLETEDVRKSIVTDVFAVFIEQAQNIRNYMLKKNWTGNPHLSSSIISIGKQGDKYVVSSGNVVEKADVDAIVQRLNMVANLDKMQLKALFKEQKRKETAPGTAGLGLIDIARRASESMLYSVREIDNNHSFLSLKVSL